MRLRRIFLILFFAALLEALVSFRVIVRFEIILLTLLYFSLKVNSRNALMLGAFAGFMKDVISMSSSVQYIIIFAALAYLFNRLRKYLYEIPENVMVASTAVALFIYAFLFFVLKTTASASSGNFNIILYCALVVFFNSLISPIVFKILKKCA